MRLWCRAGWVSPGTPVGSLKDFFSQFSGTPAATPVADLTDNVVQITLNEFAIPHELVIEPVRIVDVPLKQGGHQAEAAFIAEDRAAAQAKGFRYVIFIIMSGDEETVRMVAEQVLPNVTLA